MTPPIDPSPPVPRLSTSRSVLAVSPDNFEGLKGAALGLAHLAQEEEHRVLHQLVATANGMVGRAATPYPNLNLSTNLTLIFYRQT